MIVCPRCGHKNDDRAMNCVNCRINLQWALENPAEVAQREAPVARPASSDSGLKDGGGRRKLKRKTYETRPEKLRDFLVGFFGWFVINGLIWLLFGSWQKHDVLTYNYGIENLCVLPLNVIALIILAFLRRWISLGMLAAIALNLAVALILGLTQYGICAVPFFAGLPK